MRYEVDESFLKSCRPLLDHQIVEVSQCATDLIDVRVHHAQPFPGKGGEEPGVIEQFECPNLVSTQNNNRRLRPDDLAQRSLGNDNTIRKHHQPITLLGLLEMVGCHQDADPA
jgi:hypothetical protein